jgi:hypothetical protein
MTFVIEYKNYHICIMSDKEYKEFEAILLQQREKISKSKKASKKVLVDLGIFHLLVPLNKEAKRAL